ncbi:MAG: hypothetical protein KC503_24545 [Myxococcales bacterium]|nr:hypothetical protein [Myxococcales bacterium]
MRSSAARRFLERFERARAINGDDADDRFGGAALALDVDVLTALEAEAVVCEVAASDGLAALSAIDRYFALPAGVGLLEGRPVAWLPAERRERLEEAWLRLLERSGGRDSMLARVAPYLEGRAAAVDAVQHAADALARVLASARQQQLDVLLVCGARA